MQCKDLDYFNFYVKTLTINAHPLEDNVVAIDDEKVICEVREHLCLYNTQIMDYKIQLKEENA